GRERHWALDAHLPLEDVPVEDERRVGVRPQRLALAALAVGVEDEPSSRHVEGPADDHARGGSAIGVHGGHGHGRSVADGSTGLGDPLLYERQWIVGQGLGKRRDVMAQNTTTPRLTEPPRRAANPSLISSSL